MDFIQAIKEMSQGKELFIENYEPEKNRYFMEDNCIYWRYINQTQEEAVKENHRCYLRNYSEGNDWRVNKESNLSEKIYTKIHSDNTECFQLFDVKESIQRLKFKFRKLSQRTPGELDEFFEEIDKIFGPKLI